MPSTDLSTAAEALLRALEAEGLDFEEMRVLRAALEEKIVPYSIRVSNPVLLGLLGEWPRKPGIIVEVS